MLTNRNQDGNQLFLSLPIEITLILFPFNVDYLKMMINFRAEWISPISQNQSTLKNIMSLSYISKSIYQLFDPTRNNFLDKTLLQAVLHGNQEQVLKILNVKPELLGVITTGKDRANRVVKATPYQAAAANMDKPLCESMEPFFVKWKGSEEKAVYERRRQLKEQFPDQSSTTYLLPTDYFNHLIDCFLQYKDHLDSEEMNNLLENFRKDVTAKKNETLKKGFYFDMRIFIEAGIAFNKNFKQLDNNKARFIYCKAILGYIQSLLPVYFAQAMCSGLDHIINDAPLKRNLKLGPGHGREDDFYMHSYRNNDIDAGTVCGNKELGFTSCIIQEKSDAFAVSVWTQWNINAMRKTIIACIPYMNARISYIQTLLDFPVLLNEKNKEEAERRFKFQA